MEGILRYIEDSGESRLRDFRFLENIGLDSTDPPPPWTHKADGAIIGFGIAGGKDAADDAYRWLRRGGVPVVNLAREWRHPKIPVVCTDHKPLTPGPPTHGHAESNFLSVLMIHHITAA